MHTLTHCFFSICGFSGSTTLTIDAGNSGTPKYYIANAGLSSDPIYTGFVAAVHDNNNSLTFIRTKFDAGFESAICAGSFNKDILLPRITVSRSGDSVNSVTVDYLGVTPSQEMGLLHYLMPLRYLSMLLMVMETLQL